MLYANAAYTLDDEKRKNYLLMKKASDASPLLTIFTICSHVNRHDF
jgi:hypothetical protein